MDNNSRTIIMILVVIGIIVAAVYLFRATREEYDTMQGSYERKEKTVEKDGKITHKVTEKRSNY